MKKLSGLVVTIMLGLTVSAQTNPDFVPLKEIFKNDFLIGVAVSGRTITGDAGNMVISTSTQLPVKTHDRNLCFISPLSALPEVLRDKIYNRNRPVYHREASRDSSPRADNRHKV